MIEKIRNEIIKISHFTNSPHIGSNLSCVEILYSILKLKKNKKTEFDLLLSKGHAAIAYYVILNRFNLLKKKFLDNFLKKKSILWSHVTKQINNNFLKFSFGSLGYGPGIAAGISLANNNINKKHQIYCVISDGELNEGSIWESLMFISHQCLSNITILIDCNGWQSFGKTRDVINLKPLKKKLSSFNFYVAEIDGHNIKSITNEITKKQKKPKIIICNTIKGFGLTRIQDSLESHYIPPKRSDFK